MTRAAPSRPPVQKVRSAAESGRPAAEPMQTLVAATPSGGLSRLVTAPFRSTIRSCSASVGGRRCAPSDGRRRPSRRQEPASGTVSRARTAPVSGSTTTTDSGRAAGGPLNASLPPRREGRCGPLHASWYRHRACRRGRPVEARRSRSRSRPRVRLARWARCRPASAKPSPSTSSARPVPACHSPAAARTRRAGSRASTTTTPDGPDFGTRSEHDPPAVAATTRPSSALPGNPGTCRRRSSGPRRSPAP